MDATFVTTSGITAATRTVECSFVQGSNVQRISDGVVRDGETMFGNILNRIVNACEIARLIRTQSLTQQSRYQNNHTFDDRSPGYSLRQLRLCIRSVVFRSAPDYAS